jgi:hypothetical protein
MKTIAFTTIVFLIAIQTFAMDFYEKVPNHKLKYIQADSLNLPGIALYPELLGKGFYSFNVDFSITFNHRLGADYIEDSPLSLHGVAGYRYQKKDGMIFRIGFTPFKRVNNWFLPLIGISLGYSW